MYASFRVLLVLVFALALSVASLWMDAELQRREFGWSLPVPIKPELPDLLVPPLQGVDNPGRFMAALDRPLFSPERRPPLPPAPPAPPAPPPPPDPLAGVSVVGIYEAEGIKGIFALVGGRLTRLTSKDKYEGWDLSEVNPTGVTFRRGDESRHVPVTRAVIPTPRQANNAQSNKADTQPVAAAAPVNERMAARRRMFDEARARVGLPPLSE